MPKPGMVPFSLRYRRHRCGEMVKDGFRSSGRCGSSKSFFMGVSAVRDIVSEESTGNIAKRRLLVNPYGPEIQTEFGQF